MKSPQGVVLQLRWFLGISSIIIISENTLQGAEFYVDSNGSDSGSGSQIEPWKTIQRAANVLNAGDTVIIGPGVYNERVKTKKNGTESQRITFRAADQNVFCKGFQVTNDYITIDGFSMTNGYFGPWQFEGAIDLDKRADYCWMINNRFLDFEKTSTISNRFYGICFQYSSNAASGQQYCIISNNWFRNTTYIQLKLGGYRHEIVNNIFDTPNERDAIHVFGRGHRIAGNIFTNFQSDPIIQDHCDIFQTFGDEVAESYEILIEKNLIINCPGAQICQLEQKGRANIRDWTFRNNVWINLGMAANIDIENCKWINNTFYRCTTNTGHPLLLNDNAKGTARNAVVMNNIFFECGSKPINGAYGWYCPETTNFPFVADYNFVCGVGYSPKSAAKFTELHGVNGGDPRFRNPRNYDLSLLFNGAPAGKGISQPDFNSDIRGVLRPAGGAWTIGAYECMILVTQPQSRTNNAGTTAIFTVETSGWGSISYQWRKGLDTLSDGGKISGATSASLTIANALGEDEGNYSVIVSNAAGIATSVNASLTMIDPVISTQPVSQTTTNKGTINLSVTAAGTTPLKYQWFKNGMPIARATNSFLLKTNALATDTGVYSVRITNAWNSAVTSTEVEVEVDLPVVISRQPTNVSKTYGQIQAAIFSVVVSGNNLKYQWRKNEEAIPGATTNTYVVPVITNAPTVPDLYSVIVSNGIYSVTSGSATLTSSHDVKAPTVIVITPKAIAYTDPAVMDYQMGIGGTATDNAQVTNVLFSINGSAFAPLSLNRNASSVTWTNPATVVRPGSNTLQVYSVDYSGLPSAIATVKFFYDVRSAFGLQTNKLPEGPGACFVKPTLDKILGTNDGSALLLVGRGYRLTALNVFTNGYIFTNWTFTSLTNAQELVLETNNLVLNYVMRSNMTIYANFITNPFAIYKGTYNGLFHEADEVRHYSAGSISITTSEKFGYSGKLLLDGDTVTFSGSFDLEGRSTTSVSRVNKGKSALQLKLVMDFMGASQTITGSVADLSIGWTSHILADRHLWNKTNNPATLYATNYTMAIPGFEDNADGPVGNGFALISVDTAGQIKVTGSMADGEAITQTTTLSQNGKWPFHVPLYTDTNDVVAGYPIKRARGELMGWLNFAVNTKAFLKNGNLAPLGNLDWIKTGSTNSGWTHGFTNQVEVLSSIQESPAFGEVYTPFKNFLAVLSDGALDSSITNLVTLMTNNTFFVDTTRTNMTPVYTNKFTAALNAKSGFITGTFTNQPNSGKTIPWKGVFLQDHTSGFGFFTDKAITNAGGKIHLKPIPH